MERVRVDFMGHDERQLTPPAFAIYLVGKVLGIMPGTTVAALWTHERSYYQHMHPVVQCWDIVKDARKYQGPHPIIAHPPCGPWGVLAWSSRQSKEDGIMAIELVHKYGGIVEQPHTSKLFRQYGRGGEIEIVNQSLFGHRAEKKTALYIVKV